MTSTLLKQLSIGIVFLTLKSWLFGHDMVPGAQQTQPILLTNGIIHTITGATLENGQLLFENGTITTVRQNIDPPGNTEVIDLEGKHVYPGMISAYSSLGHIEINSVRATIDTGELGAFNPNLRAEVAINPDSEAIPVTRANGILSSHVAPRTSGGGLIAGKSALVNLDGWTYEEMTVAAPVGMQITWPRAPRNRDFEVDPTSTNNPTRAEENYAGQIQNLVDVFEDARAFWKAKDTSSDLDVDIRMEALGAVLKKEIPIHVQANTVRQIRDAVHWAKQEGFELVIFGASDAHLVADLLQDNGVPVVIGRVNATTSRRWESYDSKATHPTKLYAAGVRFAIAYASSPSNERNLPYEAGKAVAFGLPYEEALKAVTIYPAEILGVADRLGSLEAGKDATLFVSSGDPLDIRSNLELAFIQGRLVDLSSRHTQLFEKYQQKYQQD